MLFTFGPILERAALRANVWPRFLIGKPTKTYLRYSSARYTCSSHHVDKVFVETGASGEFFSAADKKGCKQAFYMVRNFVQVI